MRKKYLLIKQHIQQSNGLLQPLGARHPWHSVLINDRPAFNRDHHVFRRAPYANKLKLSRQMLVN